MEKNGRWRILSSLMCLLPIVAGLLLWNELPEQLPIHWNWKGEVDGWMHKGLFVVGVPLLMLGLHWLGVWALYADPRKQNHSDKMRKLMHWLIPALCVLCMALSYSFAMGQGLRIERIASVLAGVLFMIVGNYLPKCKQNYTVGIKLSWTLHSEENWNRTHRFAGWLWMLGGLLILWSGFLGWLWMLLPVFLGMAVGPIVYSYLCFCREKKQTK